MATIRGRAIQRVKRARLHCDKIIDQLVPLEDTYKEYPEFTEALRDIILLVHDLGEVIEAQSLLEPLGAAIRENYQHGIE